jgi:arylformamidase
MNEAVRIVDLTYPIHEGMTTFPRPWHPVVEITQMGRHGIENRETRKLVLGTHTGTHCDAPRHFVPDGNTVENLPLDVLVGPASIVDFSYAAPMQIMDVADFERQLDAGRPDRIIIRYDWSVHWGTMKFYADHPYLSHRAAEWLCRMGVKLIAMDTPTPDAPLHAPQSDEDSPIHKLLLQNDVVLAEYLCNLNQLTSKDVFLVVLPLKIVSADGAPARCIAIESCTLMEPCKR